VAEGKVGSGWAALGVTVVSAIPGAFLFLIPPAITTATGLLFIPAMFGMMRRRIVQERNALQVH
jgi:hypothetical protein